VEGLGDIREAELYDALCRRFGRNCVYHSPKIRVHRQEKELGDVVVLALPYMIVFQSKWKKMTSEDLHGDKGDLYKSRLIKTMQKAACQFKELASSLRQNVIIELPQVWFPESDETYQFPLELVDHVVPVVVVDFEDKMYDDPDARFEGVPPVVTEVPSQVKSWGAVHSFILRDFYRIINQLFTVGDLLYWLKEREKFLCGGKRSIVGYTELTLFAMYLENDSSWQTLNEADCVFFVGNDNFERMTRKMRKSFAKRQKIFGQRNLLDAIDDTMVRSLIMDETPSRNESILSYLMCQGRLLCCTAISKRAMALKLGSYLCCVKRGGDGFRGGFAISDKPIPLMGTVFYYGVAPYDTKASALKYFARAYARTLAVLRDQGLDKITKEVLVLFVQSRTHQVFCLVKKIEEKDYCQAPRNEIVSHAMYSLAKQNTKFSEWDIVRGEFCA